MIYPAYSLHNEVILYSSYTLSYILGLVNGGRRVQLGVEFLYQHVSINCKEIEMVSLAQQEINGLVTIMEEQIDRVLEDGAEGILCELQRYVRRYPWRNIDEP